MSGNGCIESANDLTRNQRKFVDWLATPKYDRIPSTQKALAKELGVHETTISRWKDRIAQEIINGEARAKLATHLPDVFGSMIDQAERGSYQHQKLYFEMIGEYRQGVDITSGGEPLPIQFIREQRHDSDPD